MSQKPSIVATQQNPVPVKNVLAEKVLTPMIWLALGFTLGKFTGKKKAS